MSDIAEILVDLLAVGDLEIRKTRSSRADYQPAIYARADRSGGGLDAWKVLESEDVEATLLATLQELQQKVKDWPRGYCSSK